MLWEPSSSMWCLSFECNCLPRTGLLPHLSFHSSLKYLDYSIWCKFPELYCRRESPPHLTRQTEDVNSMIVISTAPQACWSLRTGQVHPCDTTCCLTISPSENCAQAHHRPCNPATSPALLKMLCQKSLRSLRPFRAWGHLVSLHSPAINLALLQTPTFQLVWPHCVLGTWTCVNIIPGWPSINTWGPNVPRVILKVVGKSQGGGCLWWCWGGGAGRGSTIVCVVWLSLINGGCPEIWRTMASLMALLLYLKETFVFS